MNNLKVILLASILSLITFSQSYAEEDTYTIPGSSEKFHRIANLKHLGVEVYANIYSDHGDWCR